MSDPDEIIEARKYVKKGFKYYEKGDLDRACPLLTKALSIFLKYVDEKGRFIYAKETSKLLCSLPYGCIVRASKGECPE